MPDDSAPPLNNASAALAGAAPVGASERLASLDVIRGVAVLGILLMNIDGFGLAWAGHVNPTDVGVSTPLDVLVWAVQSVFFEGTMRGLFSLLFGAGVILLTSRIEARANPREAMKIHYVRNVWLLLFGLFHAYVLLWSGDILYIYGLTALFLFPLRRLRPRKLIMIAVVIMLAMIALNLWLVDVRVEQERAALAARAVLDEGGLLDADQREALDEWRGLTVMNLADAQEQRQAMRSGWLTILQYIASGNLYGQTIETAKWVLWDAASFMLIGMALMKLGVMSGLRSIRLYVMLLLGGYSIGLAVNVYELLYQWNNQFHPVAVEVQFLTYDIGRLAMTLGHIGAIVLFVRSGLLRGLARALAATGRMALTNYIMHSVLCAFIFYGFGFGLYDRLSRSELWLVVVWIWAFQLIASPLWLRWFHFGPLEWLWRSLTYLRFQPMRR